MRSLLVPDRIGPVANLLSCHAPLGHLVSVVIAPGVDVDQILDWHERNGDTALAASRRALAGKVRESFNRRFWFDEGGYLYDIVDGDQILSFALRYPVLDRSRWDAVLRVVETRLVTPVGLRSLDPSHPEYKPKYYGDLRARDAAYHQGTVWAWLIGPFVDAWLNAHPGHPEDARRYLVGFLPHLDDACVGSISEIFDAQEPYTPRGCVAQAWSVAEVLRCWVKTASAREAEQAASQLAAHGASVPGLPA